MTIKGHIARALIGGEEPQIIKDLRAHEARLLADPVVQARKREIAKESNREMLQLMVPAAIAAALLISAGSWSIREGWFAGTVTAFVASLPYCVLAMLLATAVAVKDGFHSDSAWIRKISYGVLVLSCLYFLVLASILTAFLYGAFR